MGGRKAGSLRGQDVVFCLLLSQNMNPATFFLLPFNVLWSLKQIMVIPQYSTAHSVLHVWCVNIYKLDEICKIVNMA